MHPGVDCKWTHYHVPGKAKRQRLFLFWHVFYIHNWPAWWLGFMCWQVPGGDPARRHMSWLPVTQWLNGGTLLFHGSIRITTNSEGALEFFFIAIIEVSTVAQLELLSNEITFVLFLISHWEKSKEILAVCLLMLIKKMVLINEMDW